jgi:hypothetical protein
MVPFMMAVVMLQCLSIVKPCAGSGQRGGLDELICAVRAPCCIGCERGLPCSHAAYLALNKCEQRLLLRNLQRIGIPL